MRQTAGILHHAHQHGSARGQHQQLLTALTLPCLRITLCSLSRHVAGQPKHSDTHIVTQRLELPVIHAGRATFTHRLLLLPLLPLLLLPPLPLLKQQQLRDCQQDVPAVCC